MHIHKEYFRPSLADYLDNHSEVAGCMLAKITHLLTHSFHIANDNGFQFYGHTLGHQCTNVNVCMIMCLFYPPMKCLIEDNIDIIPSMDVDTQLLTYLIAMIKKAHPGGSKQHRCCNQSLEIHV